MVTELAYFKILKIHNHPKYIIEKNLKNESKKNTKSDFIVQFGYPYEETFFVWIKKKVKRRNLLNNELI